MEHWARSALGKLLDGVQSQDSEVRKTIHRVMSIIEDSDEYVFRDPKLEKVTKEIENCQAIEDLVGILEAVLKITGMDDYAIAVVSHGRGAICEKRYCTSYPLEWLRTYEENCFQHVDPILLRAIYAKDHELEPFVWTRDDLISPLTKVFWEEAKRHGIGQQGYSVVAPCKNDAKILINFTSQLSGRAFEELIFVWGSDLAHTSLIIGTKFFDLSSRSQGLSNDLSDYELRYLFELATSPNFATRRKGAGSELQETMTQEMILAKLNAKTLYEAVIKAFSLRLFDLVPFGADENARDQIIHMEGQREVS